MAELLGGGWVQLRQESRVKPIEFTLVSPDLLRSRAEVAVVERRLKRAKFAGEALMQEYLSLLIDSDQFTDNARPGFLINPITDERLELDRFYPPDLAFEYHGAQHEHATEFASQAEVEAQRLRDLIKVGLCVYSGIRIVIIRAADLSLEGMIRGIGSSRPLRDLTGHQALIDLLEDATICYQAAAKATKVSGTRQGRR
jgi:hypothetical protein